MKNILLVLFAFSASATITKAQNIGIETSTYVSAGLVGGSFGKENYSHTFGVDAQILTKISTSFKFGVDVGYSHLFKKAPLENDLSVSKTSLVLRWCPATLLSKLTGKEASSSKFYLEGGLGHAFNDDILDDLLFNYNRLKVGTELLRFDFGVSLAGYSVNKALSNGLMNTYSVYFGYKF